jgi:hypothetical protein
MNYNYVEYLNKGTVKVKLHQWWKENVVGGEEWEDMRVYWGPDVVRLRWLAWAVNEGIYKYDVEATR